MPRSLSMNEQLLLQALIEAKQNAIPGGAGHVGRPASALAMNAYLGDMPLSGEQQREQGVIDNVDARFNTLREEERKTQTADAARRFANRTGVSEDLPPKDFTAENFPPMASHAPTSPRIIKRVSPSAIPTRGDVATGFGTSPETKTIRRFSNNQTPTDPDAAMSERERANLDPRVMSERIRSEGDQAVARIAASAKDKTPSGAPSQYAIDTATRTIAAVDEVLPKVDNTTAGVGSLMRHIPGSDAANVSADLSRVASNVAFNALQAMRDASKTGGALGQVSERELDLLSGVEGSIRQDQSPPNLRKNLTLIRESQQRFLDAAKRFGNGGGGTSGTTRTVGRFVIEE